MASILYSNEKNLLLLRCSLCFFRRFFGCWLLCWLGGLWFFGCSLLCWFGGLCLLWALRLLCCGLLFWRFGLLFTCWFFGFRLLGLLGLIFLDSLVQLEASGSSGSLGLDEF